MSRHDFFWKLDRLYFIQSPIFGHESLPDWVIDDIEEYKKRYQMTLPAEESVEKMKARMGKPIPHHWPYRMYYPELAVPKEDNRGKNLSTDVVLSAQQSGK